MRYVPHALAIATLSLGALAVADSPPLFTDWGPAENLGYPVNSAYLDSCVSISKDRLTLYFSSNRQTGNPASTDRDLYVSTRASVDEPWGEPQPLTMLNTAVWDSCPALSLDEHRLYFTSARPGCGERDIWVSRRQQRQDELGWKAPENVGCAADGSVNTDAVEVFPSFFEDEAGRVLMYFGSSRAGSWGPMDLYQCEVLVDGGFGPVTSLAELNSAAMEHSVAVRRDGLEIIFGSNRTGTFRFWTSTRSSTSEPWSPPVPVPSLPGGAGGRFAMSFDGRELYFSLQAPGTLGGLDLWVARRERLR